MPISIVIPKMKDYPIVDKWIRDTEKYFLEMLNSPDHPLIVNKKTFEGDVINYMQRKYPISGKDMDDARVRVGFDWSMGQY
jgi:hypothetical protein